MEGDSVDSVLTIVLFLLPGLTAVRVNNALDPLFKDRDSQGSEFNTTVYAVLNNLPCIFVGWIGWSISEHQSLTLLTWTTQLDHWRPATIYFVGASLFAYGIESVLKAKIRDYVAGRRNTKRRQLSLPMFDDVEAWEVFIGAEDNLCLRVRPAHGSTFIAGSLRSASKPGDASQGMVLEQTQGLTELADLLTNPLRSYLDTRTGILYEVFDQQAVARAIEFQRTQNTLALL